MMMLKMVMIKDNDEADGEHTLTKVAKLHQQHE